MILRLISGLRHNSGEGNHSSFHFIALPGEGEVNDVKPRKNPGKNRPEDRTITMPGTDNGNGGSQSDSCLSDRLSGLSDDLSNDHGFASKSARGRI